jgi:uncharacterized protein
MTSLPRQTALITGASSGIGAVYADRLAARGHDLILVARRGDRLQALATRLTATHGVIVRPVIADLATEPGIATVEALLRTDPSITLLLNNAGLSRVGPFTDLSAVDHASLLMVNLVAPSRLAHAALPGFLARDAGTIINIGSVNSVRPYPGTAVYSGTKAYILSLSLALQDEVANTGVRVQAVLPAATATEIWDGSGFELKDVPVHLVMTTEAMVDAALSGLDQGEAVTMPSVADHACWERYETASRELFGAASNSQPAARYAAA